MCGKMLIVYNVITSKLPAAKRFTRESIFLKESVSSVGDAKTWRDFKINHQPVVSVRKHEGRCLPF